MAFSNFFEAIDQAIETYDLPKGEPAISTAARVLMDVSGNVIFSADDGSNPTLAIALAADLSIVTAVTPVTTDTITSATTTQNQVFYITPAGTIAALTFVFPTNANSRIGQVIRLNSTQIVTALTVSSAGLTLLGTAVTALAVNTPVQWQKIAASTWLRI